MSLLSVFILLLEAQIVLSAAIGKSSIIRNEKAKLLRGLQLSERPAPFGDVFWRSERDIDPSQWLERGTETVTFAPVKAEGFCKPVDSDEPITNCFTFQLQSIGSIIGAEMVLRVAPALRKENISIMFYEVSRWGIDFKTLEKMNVIGSSSNEDLSLRIDLKDAVVSWFKVAGHQTIDRLLKVDARVNGELVDFPMVFSQRPIVEVVFAKREPERCDRNSPCCLMSFYVNFTELGWQDWLLSPSGYWANYCVGQCAYNEDTETQAILRGARSNHSAFFIPPPQCAPLKYAPLTITWAAGPNDQRQTTLHGMRVMSCSCFSH